MTISHGPADARWQTLRRRLGERLSQHLFDQVVRERALADGRRRPRLSVNLIVAGLLALAVHSAGIAAIVGGVALLLRPWTHLLIPVGGVVLVLLGVLARPRSAPEPDRVLDRASFPVLHTLTERIAAELGAPPVAGLGLSADFNASYSLVGWRRRRFIELGSPLVAILTPAELTALIAHELAHGVNGDPLRGQFLGQAVNTLARWSAAARPLDIGQAGQGTAFGPFSSLLALPFELAMLAPSELLLRAALGLLWLVMRESQRAEYLADLLAARAAGPVAMRDMLERIYLAEVVDSAVRRHALTAPNDPIHAGLAEAVGAVSATELERLRTESRRQSWQADASHPPTALRVDYLAALGDVAPRVTLSPTEQATLKEEVARLLTMTQTTLTGRQLEAIHG